jgi:hypothetical protein
MSTKAALINGEVAFVTKPHLCPLVCLTKGVDAIHTSRKWQRYTIEERMYRYSNGMALCARRGGPLHLGERRDDSWEIFVLNPDGYATGEPVGFIGSDHLRRLVAHLSDLVAA